MGLQCECQTERRHIPVEKPVAQINGNTLPCQLAAVFITGDAVNVVRRKDTSHLNPEILGGHELQLELLVDRSVVTATFRKSSGRLALEFAFTGAADVGTDHEAKEMLGIGAFSMKAAGKQRGEAQSCRPKRFCTDGHSHSASHGVN